MLDLIDTYFPEHGYDFELDRLVKWFDLVLRPAQPLPPPEIVPMMPVVEDPETAGCQDLRPSLMCFLPRLLSGWGGLWPRGAASPRGWENE